MTQFRLVGFLVVLGVAIASWITTCGAWRYDEVASGVMPLDARSFGRLTLVTLGTGGAYENPQRRGPAIAVGSGSRVALVDAGRAVSEGLRAASIPPSQPDTVYLTNLLPENTVGLDDLLQTGWIAGRSEPLRLVGPPGTAELAEALERGHRRGAEARAPVLGLAPEGARFVVEEIADGWSETRDELSVRAGALPGGPIEALAYRFEWRGRSAVVSGTGWNDEVLTAFAREANLLVHEAVYVPTPEIAEQMGLEVDPDLLRREAEFHTRLDDVGRIAERAGVDVLALVRLRPPPVYDIQITSRVDDRFRGRVAIANDGDEFTP